MQVQIGFESPRELLSARRAPKGVKTFSYLLAKAIDDLHKGKLDSSNTADEN